MDLSVLNSTSLWFGSSLWLTGEGGGNAREDVGGRKVGTAGARAAWGIEGIGGWVSRSVLVIILFQFILVSCLLRVWGGEARRDKGEGG